MNALVSRLVHLGLHFNPDIFLWRRVNIKVV